MKQFFESSLSLEPPTRVSFLYLTRTSSYRTKPLLPILNPLHPKFSSKTRHFSCLEHGRCSASLLSACVDLSGARIGGEVARGRPQGRPLLMIFTSAPPPTKPGVKGRAGQNSSATPCGSQSKEGEWQVGLSHRASRWEGERPRDAATPPVRPKKRRAPRGLRPLRTPAKRGETPLLRTPPGDVLVGGARRKRATFFGTFQILPLAAKRALSEALGCCKVCHNCGVSK